MGGNGLQNGDLSAGLKEFALTQHRINFGVQDFK
jgi:hypothetical protein